MTGKSGHMPPPSFDIFCSVVDNYGDIGVCWRLARQLAARADCGPVRLWVDDLNSFARIAPGIVPQASRQTLAGVNILGWTDSPNAEPDQPEPADVVIEAFACSPPAAYIDRLSSRQLWLNLEYLSAEDWVESCHGLPSLQPGGLRKFFFFPGFTPRTGGLLREPGLLAQRDAWQADPQGRLELLQRLGVDASWLERLSAGAALVYVYCYPQAPLEALMQALSQQGRDTLLLLPRGIWPHELPDVHANACRVEARSHDFVDQSSFDRLLWSSDLNVVRGEDSLLRAIWAGRAMIWQPYPQQDGAHLDKLEAWLARSPYPAGIRQLMQAWNEGDAPALTQARQPFLQKENVALWGKLTRTWCTELALEDDLVSRLLSFYANNDQTR